jgi:hypothetical protein
MNDSSLIREVFRGENGLRNRLSKGPKSGQAFERRLKKRIRTETPKDLQPASSSDKPVGMVAEKATRSEGDRSAHEAARGFDSSKAGKALL